MFVVDYTSGGFPIGIFEEEMNRDWSDDPDRWTDDEFS
jgi:hypothetical protein